MNRVKLFGGGASGRGGVGDMYRCTNTQKWDLIRIAKRKGLCGSI